MCTEPEKKRLLVIDDDALIRSLVSVIAGLHDLDCQGTADVAEAERWLHDYRPDIILLDMWMPERDGIEWISRLAESNCRAKLILHSGFDRRVLDSAAILAGNLGLEVLGTLEKPFRQKDLVKLLVMEAPSPDAAPRRFEVSEAELRTAIEADQLAVFFQPQVRLSDGQWIGMEALVRWNHPQHGLLSPAAFLGLTESLGLGWQLTHEVTRLALAGYAHITDQTRFDGNLAINLLGSTLVDPDFPERMYQMAGHNGCNHRNLVFELTETSMARDVNVAAEILTRLRLKGFSLSIDDFGTGYSSFELLHKLPFNELKIEVEFVRAAQTNRAARAIVENSISLARRLGIASVAEGVETREELEWLRRLGCDAAQGYFISRPVPAERLVDWSEDWRVLSSELWAEEPSVPPTKTVLLAC